MQINWSGRFFEDFEVGEVYRHPVGRTVIEADNVWFTNVTMNPHMMHFNNHFAAQSEFKQPLVNSCFTLSLVTGLSVNDVSLNGINLEWQDVRMPNPLFVGDTVYAQTEVLEKRELKSRPKQGIVTVKTTGVTEKGKVVMEFIRKVMVFKKGFSLEMQFPEINK